ncbi:hypothetical protein LY78DRAFT_438973 [Colletotrichum sublineola]|nr:hypothetical protein LY78DRAFT_438973 [Colletotrichum sublineola]
MRAMVENIICTYVHVFVGLGVLGLEADAFGGAAIFSFVSCPCSLAATKLTGGHISRPINHGPSEYTHPPFCLPVHSSGVCAGQRQLSYRYVEEGRDYLGCFLWTTAVMVYGGFPLSISLSLSLSLFCGFALTTCVGYCCSVQIGSYLLARVVRRSM